LHRLRPPTAESSFRVGTLSVTNKQETGSSLRSWLAATSAVWPRELGR
jgi:hypothetical protein